MIRRMVFETIELGLSFDRPVFLIQGTKPTESFGFWRGKNKKRGISVIFAKFRGISNN